MTSSYNPVDNHYVLEESSRNISTVWEEGSFNPPIPFTSADNHWDDTDPLSMGAYDAQYGGGLVYDFFLNQLGRLSYDDLGAKIDIRIQPFMFWGQNNAFWNGTYIGIGIGDNYVYSSFSSLKVMAHEISHGVISASADLVYENESGALNESFADILGIAASYYQDPATFSWKIGDRISLMGDFF